MKKYGKFVQLDWFDYILIGICIGVAVGSWIGFNEGARQAYLHMQTLPHYPYPSLINGS